uniref:Ig-like domain-containing protein n=1 Tax=Cyprinodon variegatus TaxID=28743 RepID=A0A3Q2CLX6_CYPVA
MLSPTGVKCEQLTQPASMFVQPGQTLTISCQVSYSVTSYGTAWIRQPTGKALEWMGVIWSGGSNDYASRFQGRIEITRDTNKNIVNLRLSSMKPEDSAVYYCARETQWLMKAERLYKNSQSRKQELHQNHTRSKSLVFHRIT